MKKGPSHTNKKLQATLHITPVSNSISQNILLQNFDAVQSDAPYIPSALEYLSYFTSMTLFSPGMIKSTAYVILLG